MTDPTGSAAQLIQVALTPVFLLSGTGILLGLFNTRLARVADEMARRRTSSRATPTCAVTSRAWSIGGGCWTPWNSPPPVAERRHLPGWLWSVGRRPITDQTNPAANSISQHSFAGR